MRFLLIILVFLTESMAVDQFFAVRLGFGIDGFSGKDTKEGMTGGFAWAGSAFGAQPISDGKNYWGVEAGLVQQRMSSDTVVWNNSSGQFDQSAKMDLRFEKLDLAFFAGRHFDGDIFLMAGPQLTYLVGCTKNYASTQVACDEEYSPFQADAQVRLMFFIIEPLAIDFKYVQGFLPADANGTLKSYAYTGTIGLLYLF